MLEFQKKLYFSLFLLFSTIGEIKSCTDIENYNVSEISKKSLVTSLFDSPQSIILNDEEKKYILRIVCNENKDCINFGTEKDNEISFNRWTLYSRSMYSLARLGDQNYRDKLLEEFKKRSTMLEIIDCYTDGKPYELCLLGIWNQVASYDLKERKSLIEAAKNGNVIHKNKKLENFWKNYNFYFEDI